MGIMMMAFLGQAAAHPRNFSSLSLPLPRYSPDVWKLIRWLLVQNAAARPTADEIMELEMVSGSACWSSCSSLPSSVSCFLARLVGAPLADEIMGLEMVRVICGVLLVCGDALLSAGDARSSPFGCATDEHLPSVGPCTLLLLEQVQARLHLLPREVRAAVDGRRRQAILPSVFKVGWRVGGWVGGWVGGCAWAGASLASISGALERSMPSRHNVSSVPQLPSSATVSMCNKCVLPLPLYLHLQISANPETWPQLNAVLPPARYPDDGQGVAAALCRLDTVCDSFPAATAGSDHQQQGRAAAANGASSGGSNGAARKGGQGSTLFDFRAAYPGESPRERLRRASTSAAAWEQAQLDKQQVAAGEQRPQGAGQPPAGQQQQEMGAASQQQQQQQQQKQQQRRRSMSDALRSRPRPPQLSPRLATSGGRGKFDASLPVEFGGAYNGVGGTGPKLAPAVARGSDLEDASYYGGDGTSTYGGSYHGEERFKISSWTKANATWAACAAQCAEVVR